MKSTPPGLFSHHIFSYLVCYFPFYLFATSIFRSILSKTQKYLTEFSFLLFASINLLQFYLVNLTISGTVTRKGLTTPLTRRVASICSLCAGTIYIVLCGSPTGSIILVSSPREIPTVAVLRHPFLFEEIPT